MEAVEVHARWCAGGCPRWLGSGFPTCRPTPCVCAATRKNAEERGLPGRCWWTNRVTLKATSRCPCWGASRDDKPGDCCGNHSANPHYLLTATALTDPDDVPPPEAGDTVHDTETEPAPPDPAGDFEPTWEDTYDIPERILTPYVRRWPGEPLNCDCPTPWDRQDDRKTDPRARGHHCPGEGCHTNWTTFAASTTHRPSWTTPCRPPGTIIDCDTGEPLLRARDVAGFVVWGW